MLKDFNKILTQESSFNELPLDIKRGTIDYKIKYFGSDNYQLSKKDICYISYGACFLGSGGGGSIGLAMLLIDKMIDDADVMHYVNPNELETTGNIAIVAILGAPDKMFEGFGETASLNAFREMNDYLTQSGQNPLTYLMLAEMGAINALIPFIISAKKGIAVINGDPSGRAVPEMSMNLLNINELPPNPVILTSDTDDSGRYQKINTQVKDAGDAESQARLFAKSNNNITGIACYLMQGADLNCSTMTEPNQVKLIQGTVGFAWNLGRHIIESRNYDEFKRFLNNFSLKSYKLFEGIITHKEERGISGFDVGKIIVTNDDETFFIYYKNESLLAWNVTKRCYAAMGPDSINFLVRKDCQPFSNGDIHSNPEQNPNNISLGTAIGIIGLCAYEKSQHTVLTDLFLKNIQEILAAFPEDQVPHPDRYIPLSDLMANCSDSVKKPALHS